MICHDTPVTDVQHLSGDYFQLSVRSDQQAENTRPGQFFMLGMPHTDFSLDPLLNRPISVLDVQPLPGGGHELLFLIKGVGRGTRLLSHLRDGDQILCHGPLGSVFPEPAPGERVALVGGGVGIAPLYYCAAAWAGQVRMVLFYGGRNATELPVRNRFAELPLEDTILVTEDGSCGRRGLVTEPLAEYAGRETFDRVYCCGPNPMMKAVMDALHHRPDTVWVSMENRMGCGLGACLGCVIPVRMGDKTEMIRICKEGPVFKGEQIRWDVRY